VKGVNFSVDGTQWRVTPIDEATAKKPRIPALPAAGLLFTSVTAELRFLAMDQDLIPSADDLAQWSVADLVALLKLAKRLEP
jgi:hypothetical protein